MRGVFQIDRRDFFFTADAKYNPLSKRDFPFSSVKATCRLVPVKRDNRYADSEKDFERVISNLKAFENLAPKEAGEEVSSVVAQLGGPKVTDASIKLSHTLFKVNFFLHTHDER